MNIKQKVTIKIRQIYIDIFVNWIFVGVNWFFFLIYAEQKDLKLEDDTYQKELFINSC